MLQKPRPFSTTFFKWKELATSIIQGIAITAASLFIYQYAVYQQYDEALTRTMVFTVLITSNIFLTLINRSFYYSIFTTLKYKNNLVALIISITVSLVALMLYVKPITNFFSFQTLNLSQLFIAVLIGFVSVVWFELVKWLKRRKMMKD